MKKPPLTWIYVFTGILDKITVKEWDARTEKTLPHTFNIMKSYAIMPFTPQIMSNYETMPNGPKVYVSNSNENDGNKIIYFYITKIFSISTIQFRSTQRKIDAFFLEKHVTLEW